MAKIVYRKLEGCPGVYGIFDRNYMLGTTTEAELRYTLDLCEKDLASGRCMGDLVKSYEKLRASILEALEVA